MPIRHQLARTAGPGGSSDITTNHGPRSNQADQLRLDDVDLDLSPRDPIGSVRQEEKPRVFDLGGDS